jgi:Ca2+-binding RTX toxin-like protein
MKSRLRLGLESFEARVTPAVTVGLNAGILSASSDAAADRVLATTINNGATIQVNYTDAGGAVQTKTFAAIDVTSIVLVGNGGDDYLANQTGVATTISGGDGNDYLEGGTGNDVLNGNGGSDIAVDNAGGINTFDGGSGNDTLSSIIAGATMIGGDGNDTLYDIIGGTFFDAGAGTDIVIGRNDNTILGGEQVVRFGSTTAPFLVIGDVLYINGSAADDTVAVSRGADNTLVVNFNGVKTTVDATGVRSIAALGGAGDDLLVNNTELFMVAYGGDGNDALIGGSGFDFLKGGGGNDLVTGRSTGDLISGDLGQDLLISGLPVVLPQGRDIVLADGTDLVISDGNDVVVGTFLANFRSA